MTFSAKQKIGIITFLFLSTTVFFQNCSHRGFDSQISSTAPTNQIFSDPTGLKASCLINGTNIPHAASITMYQLSNPAVGQACVAEQRICNDGVLSGSYTNATCTPANNPVNPGGTASCTFNGVTVPHGGLIAAYAVQSVTTDVKDCIRENRVCTNGLLSGSYLYSSCSVSTPTPAVDNCAGTPVHFDLNASESYKRLLSGAFSNYGMAPLAPVIMGNNQHMIIRLTINANDTTNGRQAAAFSFSDVGPIRAGRFVTISRSKCDYSSTAFWVSGRNIVSNQPIAQNSATKTILMNDTRSATSGEAKMTTGVWYINIKNTECPQGAVCDVVSTWNN